MIVLRCEIIRNTSAGAGSLGHMAAVVKEKTGQNGGGQALSPHGLQTHGHVRAEVTYGSGHACNLYLTSPCLCTVAGVWLCLRAQPRQSTLRQLCQSGNTKYVCGSSGSSSFLPADGWRLACPGFSKRNSEI